MRENEGWKDSNVESELIIGAIGGPKWGVGPVRPEQGLLRIRKELGLYANIRPASFASESLLKHSPLKEDRARGVDIVVVRELIGGACKCPAVPDVIIQAFRSSDHTDFRLR